MPQGGYVTSCILRVASIHFGTTLVSCNQPDTIFLHLSFLRRSAVGRATFTVDACKIGRTTSVIHVSGTIQPGAPGGSSGERPFVVGYLTQGNLARESGVSLPTHFSLVPPSLPRGVATALRANTDPHWVLQHKPPAAWRNALQQVHTYIPRGASVAAATVDEWICLASGERFTQESLGFVCDTFPLVPDAYGLRANPEELEKLSSEKEDPGNRSNSSSKSDRQSENSPGPPPTSSSSPSPSPSPSSPTEVNLARFWFPTLVLNIEIKKLLPPEGVEWLFVRVRPKQIRNGRMDLEVVVMDEEGDLVALSWHVALLVNGERNSRGRL